MALSNNVAVITGASGDLGSVVVERFIASGATVVAVTHSASVAVSGVALSLQADVSDEAQVEQLLAAVNSQLGGPHILLNLVGGWAGGPKLHELDLSVWEHMLNLNLRSAFLCSKHALRYMLPAGYGRIINVASKSAFDLTPGSAAYGVAKAGVIALTTALAHELKGTGVSAACVAPSTIDLPKNREAMPKVDPAKFIQPEQIAETLLWLASAEGGAANGAIVPLYGGM